MASTAKPMSRMRRMRPAEPSTFQRAPCRYSSTGVSACAASASSHSACSLADSPVTLEGNSIQTWSMPSA